MAMISTRDEMNNAVIYDGGASDHLSPHREWFVGEMEPAGPNDVLMTAGDPLPIAGWGTLRLKINVKGQSRKLDLTRTAWVPRPTTTLLSERRLDEHLVLHDRGHLRVLHKNSVIFVLEKQFGLLVVKLDATNSAELRFSTRQDSENQAKFSLQAVT